MSSQQHGGWELSGLTPEQIEARIIAGAERGVHLAAEALLAKAEDTIPFDTGAMDGSAFVTEDGQGNAYAAYGSAYAVRQHEDLGLRHPNPDSPTSRPGGRARWLELTADEQVEYLRGIVVAAVQRGLEEGGTQ